MSFRHVTALTPLIAIGLAQAMMAQDLDSVSRSLNRPGARATMTDPTAASTSAVGPAIQAAFTAKDKVASGTIGVSMGRQSTGEWNPWLRMTGPIDQSDATAPVIVADLKGLRGARTITVGLNLLRWQWTTDDSVRARKFRICRTIFQDTTENSQAPDSIVNVLRTAVRSQASADQRKFVFDTLLTHLVDHRCSKHRLPEKARILFDSLTDYGRIALVGVSGDYGRQVFRFADTVGVAYRKMIAEPWSVSVGAGVYLPGMRFLVATTIRFEHSFDEEPVTQYCIPIGNSGGTQCRSLSLGPPKKRSPILWTVEGRQYINAIVGLDPRMTIDLSGVRGIGLEFPFLLRQSTDKGFTSALILGWRSKPSAQDVSDRLYIALTVGLNYGVGLRL